MPQLPGGLGRQTFGIGLFVAAGIAGTVTTPANWATSQGENVVIRRSVVYDQTSSPVFVPTTPAVVQASTPVNSASAPVVGTSRVVYDQTSVPVYKQPVTAYVGVVHSWDTDPAKSRIKRLPLSSFVLAYPIGKPAPDYTEQFIRPKRKVLPEGIAQPPYQPVVAGPTIDSMLVGAYSTATFGTSRVVYDPQAARPLNPPAAVAAATSSLASFHSSATVILRRVVYDPQAARPVFPPTAVAVAGRFVPDVQQNERLRTRVFPIPRSSFVFSYPVDDLAQDYSGQFIRTKRKILPEGIAQPPYQPVFVPPATIDSKLVGVHSSTTVILRRVVYDPTSAPVVKPVAAVVAGVELRFVPDAPQNSFRPRRIKQVPQSAFVFAYPVDDLAADYSGLFVRSKRKVLPDGIAQSPFQPAPSPTIDTKLVGAHSVATFGTSRVVYDPTAARPIFPPPPAPPTFYQADEGAPQRRISRPGIKLDLEGFERPTTQQQRLFWFETYPAVKTFQPNRIAIKTNLEGVERRLIQITVTPSYLFETIQPGWKAKPNAKAIKADLDGFEKPQRLPDPPTATPATLFDNIGPVQRTLPNRVAIKIDLDGVVWPPQRPQDLTGVIFVPPTVGQYPTGGESWWHQTHKKPAKSDRRCRFVTIDGVLTWICDRTSSEMPAEARLQALDLVYDAEGGDLEPLYEALRVEQATNANEAKRLAATLLMLAIHEAVIEDEDDDLLLLD